MAQGYEFGGRNPVGNSDKLEHYRIQIRKLKQINKNQQQSYERKIYILQKQLRSSSRSKSKQFFRDPTQNINSELIKRDKEINRLAEENERLKKQNYKNPDRQLIKKRDLFESMADKDQQIVKLKRAIHDLENRYDGRYFNENKMKKDYEILMNENEKLKKQIQYRIDKKEDKRQEINPQIMQFVRYKNHNQILQRQNEYLKREIKKIDEQKQLRRDVQLGLGQKSENQALRKQLKESMEKNKQLYYLVQKLQRENKMLYDEVEILRKNRGIIHQQSSKKSSSPSHYSIKQEQEVYSSTRKHKPIFNKAPVSQSQYSNRKSEPRKSESVVESRINNGESNGRISEEQKKSVVRQMGSPETTRKRGYYDQFLLAQVLKNTQKQKQK